MGIFELVIGLLFVGGLLALWANRVGLPCPALLALVGTLLALLPACRCAAEPARAVRDAHFAALQLRAVALQREALTQLRADNVIGDDAFHALEEELDLLELSAEAQVRPDDAAALAGEEGATS